MGALAARLHNHAENWEPPAAFARWTYDGDALSNLLDPFRTHLPDDLNADLDTMLDGLQSAGRTIGRTPANFGLAHLDFKQVNTLYRDGEIVAIDFDEFGYSYFLQDVATGLNGPSWEDGYEPVRSAFLQGYRAHRPLEHEELIPLLQAGRCGEILLDSLQHASREGVWFAWQHMRVAMGMAEMTPPE
tara:strand:- start:122 stop:685 length:564 start_codon:yes stop_codon:yes gene_type:complete